MPPANKIVAGNVSTHAIKMFFTVPDCNPVRLATMVPATADDSTWVVETGIPVILAIPMAAAAVICAAGTLDHHGVAQTGSGQQQ